MVGMRGLGALIACGNPTLGGYFYKDDSNQMISDYRIAAYDGDRPSDYVIGGTSYWNRSDGKDVARCPGLQPVVTTNNQTGATTNTTVTTNSTVPIVSGFDFGSIPIWAYGAVAALGLFLMIKK